jgi:hypothetical protein
MKIDDILHDLINSLKPLCNFLMRSLIKLGKPLKLDVLGPGVCRAGSGRRVRFSAVLLAAVLRISPPLAKMTFGRSLGVFPGTKGSPKM